MNICPSCDRGGYCSADHWPDIKCYFCGLLFCWITGKQFPARSKAE
jgi:hypothetical protein